MKTILTFAVGIFLLINVFSVNVNAVPQVIFSNLNFTIDMNQSNIVWHILGEGIDAKDTIAYTCNATLSYSKPSLPVVLSRDVCGADLDAAILLRSLAINNNMSEKYDACMEQNRIMAGTIGACTVDGGYKSNYTQSQDMLTVCRQQLSDKDSTINTKDSSVKSLEQQRLGLAALVLVAGFLCWHFYRKYTPRVVNTPGISALPRGQRI